MEQKTVGAQTRRLRTCPSVLSFAAVGGRFEGEGPLREYFDELSEDHFFGEKTWEKGESTMQRHALSRALEKVGLKVSDLDLIFAGDLLNQCVGSSFALRESRIPFYGLCGNWASPFSACTGPVPPWARHWRWRRCSLTAALRKPSPPKPVPTSAPPSGSTGCLCPTARSARRPRSGRPQAAVAASSRARARGPISHT